MKKLIYLSVMLSCVISTKVMAQVSALWIRHHVDTEAITDNTQSQEDTSTKNTSQTNEQNSVKYSMYEQDAKKAHDNDNLERSLCLYLQAKNYAKTYEENSEVRFGLASVYLDMEDYQNSLCLYSELLNRKTSNGDHEAALNGYVRSLSNLDMPMKAYYSVPCDFHFTSPDLVLGLAQAAYWADWPNKAWNILNCHCKLIKKEKYEDLLWQVMSEAAPRIVHYRHEFESDVDGFRIHRDQVGYTNHYSSMFNTSILMNHNAYTLPNTTAVDANIVRVQEEGWLNDHVHYAGAIAAGNYDNRWHPLLWVANLGYKFNDCLAIDINNFKDVVEYNLALLDRIAYEESSFNVTCEPVYGLYLTGAIWHDNFTDHNKRNGSSGNFKYLLNQKIGLYFEYFIQSYRDKFTSPNYYSPLKYREDCFSLTVQTAACDTWHYYATGGLGRQWENNGPKEPTHKIEAGLRGPIYKCLFIDAYYGYNDNAGLISGFARRYCGLNVQWIF